MYKETIITIAETLPADGAKLIQVIKSKVIETEMFKSWSKSKTISFSDFSIIDSRGKEDKGKTVKLSYTQKGTKTKGFYLIVIHSDTKFIILFDDLVGDL